ncbi:MULTISPECIES: FxLD family lanthipeptide [unclassified Frankia]|uniref:FxLD family lanthipeptide n=1 Tax=unclassified Frankia TaxID=2632575 RepID=UPI000AF4D757|nr:MULTISPECIES: FxLD family lanthipeptide [unclassified Frankia]MCM3883091.1 FxLD family lanthipeptide [Frankia sp. R82]
METTLTPAPADFDLDVEIATQGAIIPDLLNSTSDNCTSTCQSACSNSTCVA